jgi:hypothetical protein
MSNIWKCSELGCDKSFANVNSLRRHVLLNHHKKYRKNGSALLFEGQHLECRLQAAKKQQMNSRQRRAKMARETIGASEERLDISVDLIETAENAGSSLQAMVPPADQPIITEPGHIEPWDWEEMLFEKLPVDLEALLQSSDNVEVNTAMDGSPQGHDSEMSTGVAVATQTESAVVGVSAVEVQASVTQCDGSTQSYRKATRRVSRRIQASTEMVNKRVQVIPGDQNLPAGVTIHHFLQALRQSPDAGPSILTGRLMTESAVMPADRPTIELLFTAMAAAQRDMLQFIDKPIETTKQQRLPANVAIDACRRRLAEYWNRPLPEVANN